MIVDVGGRRSGKTTRILRLAATSLYPERAMIICHSAGEAERLKKEFSNIYPGIKLPKIITFGVTPLRGIHGPVYIDNADLILQHLVGQQVNYISLTGETL